MAKQSFLRGTLILIAAGMITRFLGFINRLVIARVMGEEGVGLYMMALPTLFLVITLTQLGLPVAISKRVSEAEAKNNYVKVKQILVISLLITSITSIVFTVSMIGAAPFIATTLLTDERTIYPLVAISPIVPITAISSVLKGYFQGRQNMKPQSFALVIEQAVRISFVAFFVELLIPYGIEFAATGAMFSVILGELASMVYLARAFKSEKSIHVREHFFHYVRSGKNTIRELFSISLPSTGSRVIGNISHFLEPILVAQSLALAGISSSLATKQYGELTGYVMPLLFLPTFITNSLSITLVPSISEADARQNKAMISYRIHQAIRISFASGAIATVALTLFAEPILTYMYGTPAASHFLVLMAPFFILLYIQAPLQAALQALDLARPAMWNSLIGAVTKLAVLFLLGSNPNFGIDGAAIAMCVGVVLVTLLHLASLYKEIRFMIGGIDLIKMVSLVALTWLSGHFLQELLPSGTPSLFAFIPILLILSVIYIALLFMLRFLTKDELKQLPILHKWVS